MYCCSVLALMMYEKESSNKLEPNRITFVRPKQFSPFTAACFGSVLLSPSVVYVCDELRKEESATECCALSSHLYIISRATLQEGPFSHHPSVSEAVILYINGANGLTTGTKCSPDCPPPPLCYSVSVYFLCLSQSARSLFFPPSLPCLTFSFLFSALWLSCP